MAIPNAKRGRCPFGNAPAYMPGRAPPLQHVGAQLLAAYG